jgi:hypothetical protein
MDISIEILATHPHSPSIPYSLPYPSPSFPVKL